MLLIELSYLFFIKQKTAYEVRISDWSSDVCSSDLLRASRRALRLECCQIGIDRAQVGLRQYLAGVGRHGVDRNANLMVEGFERQPRRGQGGARRAALPHAAMAGRAAGA